MTPLVNTDQCAYPSHGRRWNSPIPQVRLHFVTGKGGTGKTTLAASLALALSIPNRRVLLVEVEGRQGIAQLCGLSSLGLAPIPVMTTPGGGTVEGLAIDIEAAFLEYLDLFYSLGLAGRAMKKVGAIEFATTIAPGLRDVILTGKIKYHTMQQDSHGQYWYDAVVVDCPPTGRITHFLDVTKAISKLAHGGPIHSQAEDVSQLLHSPQTAVHLVTLLEPLPIQETREAIQELQALQLPLGSIIVNQILPHYLSDEYCDRIAQGMIDVESLRHDCAAMGMILSTDDLAHLAKTAFEYAHQMQAYRQMIPQLEALNLPLLYVPIVFEGIHVNNLDQLAAVLYQQGVQ